VLLASEMCGSCKEFKPSFYKMVDELSENEGLKIVNVSNN
jgi:hypothetical protein